MGLIGDHFGMSIAFVIPMVCFAFIAWYAIKGIGKKIDAKNISLQHH